MTARRTINKQAHHAVEVFGGAAPTDDELGPGRFERREEERDLGRVVLTIGIERDDGCGAVVQRVAEASAQGRTLARIGNLAKDRRTGRLGLGGRVVGRPVVDDDDRQASPRTGDDDRDARALLVAGDERKDAVHTATLDHRVPRKFGRFWIKETGTGWPMEPRSGWTR